MTLDELLAKCNADAEETATPGPAVNPLDLPYWVVVVNPRRVPRRPKFVTAFATLEDAHAELGRRQQAEAERVADEREFNPSYAAYEFYVIDRPTGGTL